MTPQVVLAFARDKGAVLVVEWTIVDRDAAGAVIFRRKQAYARGVAEDGSPIAGETVPQFRTRVLAAETALRDAKLAELSGATAREDAEKTGTDVAAFGGFGT